MDDMHLRHRSQYFADKLTGEEQNIELVEKKENPNEWPKENQEEEVSYLTVRKAVSTEGLIQENDRTSPLIEDFDKRSSATFQLNGQESSVDVHFVQFAPTDEVTKRRILDVKEIDSLTLDSQPAFFLRLSKNSRSRLLASRKLYDSIMRKYQVTPRFKEFAVSFGFKPQENEFAPPACRYRTLNSSIAGTAPIYGYECAYGFRYVTLNHTGDRSKESWSIRQFAVYQKFSSIKGSIVWIFIATPKEMELRIDSYLSKCSSAVAENPFAMHLILIENALAGWRWYLVDLNQRVQTQTAEISAADIAGENLEGFAQIKFQNRLKLKRLEEMILNSLLMLRASINTIETLKDRFSRYNYDPTLVLMTDETLSTAYQEILEDSKLQLLKAESLYKCLQGASALLSDLLPYQNASSLKSIAEDSHSDNTIMRQLTEQTTKDSSSIKTITIITVLFLPATVVASFFSTQFVQIQEDNVLLSAKIWIYFAITIPLTMGLIAVWLFHPRVTYLIQRGHGKIKFWLGRIPIPRSRTWSKRNPYPLEEGRV